MANSEILTDDYLAELLAKDAKESAIKYSSMGLDGFKQSKYVQTFPEMLDIYLILADHQQINPSQILGSYATSSRIRTATMQHYSPRKLQMPALVCVV